MSKKIILGIAIILMGLAFISCEKEQITIDKEKILGTWISIDKSDTLDFVDNSNFYKSSLSMQYDHYIYKLFDNTIEIGYSGKCFIMVVPSKHKLSFDGNKLYIDFSNTSCFGFEMKPMTYERQ